MAQVEIFTPTGVLTGTSARPPLASDAPDVDAELSVDESRWYPIDGSAPKHRGPVVIDADDVLVVVTSAEPTMTVHMTWYRVVLAVGPYRVSGQLATHPGFDPARSLSRPGGTYVPLRDVTIELLDRPDAGSAERPSVLVNRYAVERAASSLMLGHYFPGARMTPVEAAAV